MIPLDTGTESNQVYSVSDMSVSLGVHICLVRKLMTKHECG